jgi:chromosome segregation ATPase
MGNLTPGTVQVITNQAMEISELNVKLAKTDSELWKEKGDRQDAEMKLLNLEKENADLKVQIAELKASDTKNALEFLALAGEMQEKSKRVTELEEAVSKIAVLADQLKLSKASTYHNRMGELIEDVTGVTLEKRNTSKTHKST